MNRLLDTIDEWAAASGAERRGRSAASLRADRASKHRRRSRLDLGRAGIRTIVWATGFRPDYSWLDVPVLDRKGNIRHDGGVVTEAPGLYVHGPAVPAAPQVEPHRRRRRRCARSERSPRGPSRRAERRHERGGRRRLIEEQRARTSAPLHRGRSQTSFFTRIARPRGSGSRLLAAPACGASDRRQNRKHLLTSSGRRVRAHLQPPLGP